MVAAETGHPRPEQTVDRNSQVIAAVAQTLGRRPGQIGVVAPGLTSATAGAVAVVSRCGRRPGGADAPPATSTWLPPPRRPPVRGRRDRVGRCWPRSSCPRARPHPGAADHRVCPGQHEGSKTPAGRRGPPAPPAPAAVDPASMSATGSPSAPGFPDALRPGHLVADCESSLNPAARQRGGGNHGHVPGIHNVHREELRRPSPASRGTLVHTAYYNAQYARRLYDASGWRPWTCRP